MSDEKMPIVPAARAAVRTIDFIYYAGLTALIVYWLLPAFHAARQK